MDFFWSLIGVLKWLAIIATVLIALLAYFQNSLLYMPKVPNLPKSPSGNPPAYRNPGNFKIQYQNIQIQSNTNIKIRGWLMFCEVATKKTIIYFHENAGNIGTRLPMARSLIRNTGFNVLLVAYRGFSDSDGVATEAGLKQDGLAIVKFASNHPRIDPNNIFILGRSLGGAVGTYVATHQQTKKYIKGIILQVTFTSIDDMVDILFKPLKHFKFLILRNHWRTLQLIKDIECPIYFVKAEKDALVPVTQMDRLIQVAKRHDKKFKQFLMIGADHNAVAEINPELYFSKFNEFLVGDYS